jgi:hypothetical protein
MKDLQHVLTHYRSRAVIGATPKAENYGHEVTKLDDQAQLSGGSSGKAENLPAPKSQELSVTNSPLLHFLR